MAELIEPDSPPTYPRPADVLLVEDGTDGARYLQRLPGRVRFVRVGPDARRFARNHLVGTVLASDRAHDNPEYESSVQALLRRSVSRAGLGVLVVHVEERLTCSCHPYRAAEKGTP